MKIEKIPVPGQALPRYIFAFRESLGMRLSFWELWKVALFPGLLSPNAVESLVKLIRRMTSGRRWIDVG